jgi:hypothetical protein
MQLRTDRLLIINLTYKSLLKSINTKKKSRGKTILSILTNYPKYKQNKRKESKQKKRKVKKQKKRKELKQKNRK